jgi:hypothetical protein
VKEVCSENAIAVIEGVMGEYKKITDELSHIDHKYSMLLISQRRVRQEKVRLLLESQPQRRRVNAYLFRNDPANAELQETLKTINAQLKIATERNE